MARVLQTSRERATAQLLECLRAFPQAPQGFQPVEPDSFWALAEEEGVAVLLAKQLVHRSVHLDRLHARQLAADLRIRSETLALLSVLEGAGITAAPLKGPLLAERLYADSALRPTSDVDVLIPRGALPQALRLLEAQGAEVLPDEQADHHHASLSRNGILLELHHWATTSFGTRVASEPLLERAQRTAAGPRVLDPVDELLFLATHAASHRLRRELWLLDLKLFGAQRPIDWAALERRAHDWEVHRPAGAALVAAGQHAGMDLSGMSRRWRIRAERALRRLPEELSVGPAPSRRLALNNAWAQWVLADSGRTRLRWARQKAGRLRGIFG